MAMNIGSGGGDEHDVPPDINTTPLIDVMLVLLIMLIVTIPLKTNAVTLQLASGPAQSTPLPPPPPAITIDIDFDGTTLWNGVALPGRDALEARLKSDVVGLPVQPLLRIRPNRLANYKHVAAVLALAQRTGAEKIGIVETAPIKGSP